MRWLVKMSSYYSLVWIISGISCELSAISCRSGLIQEEYSYHPMKMRIKEPHFPWGTLRTTPKRFNFRKYQTHTWLKNTTIPKIFQQNVIQPQTGWRQEFEAAWEKKNNAFTPKGSMAPTSLQHSILDRRLFPTTRIQGGFNEALNGTSPEPYHVPVFLTTSVLGSTSMLETESRSGFGCFVAFPVMMFHSLAFGAFMPY